MSAFRNVTCEQPASGSSLVWLLSKPTVKLKGDSLTHFATCFFFFFLFSIVIKITNDYVHRVESHSGLAMSKGGKRKYPNYRNTKNRHGGRQEL